MPTTTLSIDKDIRDLAAIRAKTDKISVSVVARMLLRDYAQGRISIWSTFSPPESYKTEIISVDEETQETINNIGSLWGKKIAWK